MRVSPRAIIFDIDDTLVDHRTAFHAATLALDGAAGSPVDFDTFHAVWSTTHRRHFDRYLVGELSYEQQALARIRETLGDGLPDQSAGDLWSVYYTSYEVAWTLFPDVVPCLDALAGHRLGIISNGQGDQQRRKLQRTGIADRFHVTVISSDHGCPKPHRDAFLRACSALETAPENAVYVGDHYDLDAEGARQAGLVGIWLDRAGARSAVHRPPMISSLLDLCRYGRTPEGSVPERRARPSHNLSGSLDDRRLVSRRRQYVRAFGTHPPRGATGGWAGLVDPGACSAADRAQTVASNHESRGRSRRIRAGCLTTAGV